MINKSVVVAVATKNGGYLLSSNEERTEWETSKSFLPEENVNKIIRSSDGSLIAATLTEGVFSSNDFGRTWKQSSRGLNVRKVWTLEEDANNKGVLYAGTQYGHLFRSMDAGKSWEEVVGLHKAPEREKWGVDWGYGTTGLTIHTILTEPGKVGRIYIITSGTGTYRSDDGGETWELLKNGINEACPIGSEENPFSKPGSKPDERLTEHLDQVHSCSHKLAISSKPGTIYQQNHCGVFVSDNAGKRWKDISPAKEIRFGFPIDVVENGRSNVFIVPANQGSCKAHNACIQGQLSVYRTSDSGKNWIELSKGLPNNVHTGVLRDAFAHDSSDHPGIYFGTSTGEVYSSTDMGENWKLIASELGRIQGISTMAV